ncbi:hypothetical protein [Sphingomonas sp.]|uniref:hypothetical protein n=1 Tax=Sphingomonas sp. TaxID=28214 RepID=UPI00307F2835
MINTTVRLGLSSKRQQLCSRENAMRVAGRIFDDHPKRVSILHTGDPLQPFRVSTDPSSHDHIVLEMVA